MNFLDENRSINVTTITESLTSLAKGFTANSGLSGEQNIFNWQMFRLFSTDYLRKIVQSDVVFQIR